MDEPRDLADTKPPAVAATRTTINGVRMFRFRCPHCRRDHFHSPEEGHRVAHCHDPASPYSSTGYTLELTACAVSEQLGQ